MKIKKNTSLFTLLLVFSLLTSNSSCSERNETVSCFPNSAISAQINLSLPAYFALQNVGGWVYENQEGAGTRGLIIVRITNGFKVYDRNAPHICQDTDTTLEVKNGTSVYCPRDGAEWILLSGQPTNIAKTSPKTYPYSLNGNILSVYN